MEPNSLRTKVPAFLSDLGKATLRGIRKCPRCGTYNGTRGLSCKNKTCGTIFRYGARKQPS
ncbi:C2orf42 isoform 8, partial [Pan troglodytes]